METSRTRSFKNFYYRDRERVEKKKIHPTMRRTACRADSLARMSDQEYVHVVLEEGEDLPPRRNREVEKNVRDARCEKDMIT